MKLDLLSGLRPRKCTPYIQPTERVARWLVHRAFEEHPSSSRRSWIHSSAWRSFGLFIPSWALQSQNITSNVAGLYAESLRCWIATAPWQRSRSSSPNLHRYRAGSEQYLDPCPEVSTCVIGWGTGPSLEPLGTGDTMSVATKTHPDLLLVSRCSLGETLPLYDFCCPVTGEANWSYSPFVSVRSRSTQGDSQTVFLGSGETVFQQGTLRATSFVML